MKFYEKIYKYYIISAKVYLKNGLVIEEEKLLQKDNYILDDAENEVKELRYFIKQGLQAGENFQFSIGDTIFQGADVSAVTLNLLNE